MGYMEISLVAPKSIRLKGKHATLIINPHDKASVYSAALLIGNPPPSSLMLQPETITIAGPGEYEVSGIKVSGISSEGQTAFTVRIDEIDILVGDLQALEKVHQKMKEHHAAIIFVEEQGNSSFVSALGTSALLFAGPQAVSVIDSLAKDEKKVTTKYTLFADKLPVETELVLLSPGS